MKARIQEPTSTALPRTACCASFHAALRRMLDRGQTRLSANCLANEMWPGARSNNAHGQCHNMAAGAAGRILRKHRGCWEVENRVWEIVPEFLPNAKAHTPATNEL